MNKFTKNKLAELAEKYKNFDTTILSDQKKLKKYILTYITELGSSYSLDEKWERVKLAEIIVEAMKNLNKK